MSLSIADIVDGTLFQSPKFNAIMVVLTPDPAHEDMERILVIDPTSISMFRAGNEAVLKTLTENEFQKVDGEFIQPSLETMGTAEDVLEELKD